MNGTVPCSEGLSPFLSLTRRSVAAGFSLGRPVRSEASPPQAEACGYKDSGMLHRKANYCLLTYRCYRTAIRHFASGAGSNRTVLPASSW